MTTYFLENGNPFVRTETKTVARIDVTVDFKFKRGERRLGVYKIYQNDALLYIGSSVNLQKRIKTSIKTIKSTSKEYFIEYCLLQDYWQMIHAERALLLKYNPPLNKQFFNPQEHVNIESFVWHSCRAEKHIYDAISNVTIVPFSVQPIDILIRTKNGNCVISLDLKESGMTPNEAFVKHYLSMYFEKYNVLFCFDWLADISNLSQSDLKIILFSLCEKGILSKSKNGYSWSH